MGAWSWGRKDRGVPDGATKGLPTVGASADGGTAPAGGAPVGMRLGVNVLPEHGRPARRGPAPQHGPDPSVATDSATASQGSVEDLHVRRAIALAELSRLAADLR